LGVGNRWTLCSLFAASGAVAVLLPAGLRRVRLGSVEFLRADALRSGRPRPADGVSLTYLCRLLVLRTADLSVSARNPEAKAEIKRKSVVEAASFRRTSRT